MPLISRVSVAHGVFGGGHVPLVLELRDSSSWSLEWRRPRRRPPPTLLHSSVDLRASEDWTLLITKWLSSPACLFLVDRVLPAGCTAASLSRQMDDALQELVRLAGGWHLRAPRRRPAFESRDVRRLRQHLRLFGECSALLRREDGVGSFSHQLIKNLDALRLRGFSAPSSLALYSFIG